jgi:hypothetical protein
VQTSEHVHSPIDNRHDRFRANHTTFCGWRAEIQLPLRRKGLQSYRKIERAKVGQASQAAEKPHNFVILSEAKNLSSI